MGSGVFLFGPDVISPSFYKITQKHLPNGLARAVSVAIFHTSTGNSRVYNMFEVMIVSRGTAGTKAAASSL